MKNCISIAFLISLLIYVPELQSQCIHVPDELYGGRLNSDRGNYGHPYTMFDRRKAAQFEFDARNELQKIRLRIYSEKPIAAKDKGGPIFEAYKAIYQNANQGLHQLLLQQIGIGAKVDIANGRHKTTHNLDADSADFMNGIVGLKLVDWTLAISPFARWAKNNAFVFLIGLDTLGNYMDTTNYSGPVNGITFRNNFRDRAMYAFDMITFSYISNQANDLQFESKNLIMWLQAYDLLKTAVLDPSINSIANRAPLPEDDKDRNEGDCSPRNKLRYLTKRIYHLSGGGEINNLLGWSVFGVVNNSIGWKNKCGNISSTSAIEKALIAV